MADENEKQGKPSIRRPFYIESNAGDAVSSERILALESVADKKGRYTRILTTGYGEYSYNVSVDAPVEVIRDILEEHGYDWVSHDELKDRATKYKKLEP